MCKDSEQSTPLHNAVIGGHIEVVKFLTTVNQQVEMKTMTLLYI